MEQEVFPPYRVGAGDIVRYGALPGKSKKSLGKTPAEIGFDYCNQLFELEKEYAALDADTRKAKRLETEPAIWEAYWSWLETVNPAGGSRLAKAVTYAKNKKPYMENYLLDGQCIMPVPSHMGKAATADDIFQLIVTAEAIAGKVSGKPFQEFFRMISAPAGLVIIQTDRRQPIISGVRPVLTR